jgi:hypothetical protein
MKLTLPKSLHTHLYPFHENKILPLVNYILLLKNTLVSVRIVPRVSVSGTIWKCVASLMYFTAQYS